MTERNIITTVIIIAIIIIIILLVRTPMRTGYFYNPSTQTTVTTYQNTVASFEDCKRAGYPIMESYPSQCRTPQGQLFVQTVTTPSQIVYPQPTIPIGGGGCYIGGCSAQICSDQKDAMSTCEYNPKYACYKQNSQCTRQSNGQCGWTQTSGLASCLANN